MISRKPLIMKFGGTSVEDACAFERVAQIIGARRDAFPVVVVSAMSRITDALLTSFAKAVRGDLKEIEASLNRHLTRYCHVARALLRTEDAGSFEAEVSATYQHIVVLLQEVVLHPSRHASLQDEVVSYGERLSAILLAYVLRAHALPARYVDARQCVLTDNEHGRATPLMAETESCTRAKVMPVIEAGEIPVLGGFIGSTPEGKTTTLGRGGSDYTATLLGAALCATEVQIWTDVLGVLTADPAIVSKAHTIPYLSYREAAELAFFGAKVLHPKTVRPAAEASIPIRILNSRLPEETGTYVGSRSVKTPESVKVITHKKGVAMIHLIPFQTDSCDELFPTIFNILRAHPSRVSLIHCSETSVSLLLNEPEILPGLTKQLERLGTLKVDAKCALIGAVGEGLGATCGVAARTFSVLADVHPFLISQGESGSNLSFLIAEEEVDEVVRRLHDTFFGETHNCSASPLAFFPPEKRHVLSG